MIRGEAGDKLGCAFTHIQRVAKHAAFHRSYLGTRPGSHTTAPPFECPTFSLVPHFLPYYHSTHHSLLYYRYHIITVMAPIEFHRYIDARGDTIIYKFDPEIARKPDPKWPNDSAVSVYHHYAVNRHIKVNYYSDLLSLDLAVERWRNDKQMSQPTVGMIMYRDKAAVSEPDVPRSQMEIQYIWKGWGHGEGYRRGWAKLSVLEMADDFFVKPPLMWTV